MMNGQEYTKSKATLFTILTIVAVMTIIPTITNVNTDFIKLKAQSTSSGVDATNVYDTKSLDLGNNIRNLVILIPNEGHESQNIGDQSTDQRLVNQPYIPQHVTVPVGTVIMWFNGDVDHDHKISLVGQGSNLNNMIFDSG
jgi:hypothetical protein